LLDVPTFAFIGSERDDLVTKVNVFPTQVSNKLDFLAPVSIAAMNTGKV
jgi:hypothetical protein